MSKLADNKKANSRGSKELWLDAAHEILVKSGVESVKVMPLAKRLGVSRTSFYWHFEDRDALLNTLIQRWQDKNTANMLKKTNQYAETIGEAVFNLFDCWIDKTLFDTQMDFAIRNWAQQSQSLKVILEQADQDRITSIRAMFLRFDFTQEQADIRAHTVYFTQVGYISMMVNDAMPERLQRTSGYVENFTGTKPTASEIKRFMARNEHLLKR
jgi:AcrR family transcriptional regulator